MQLEQLRYLVEIERSGSISAAARNLHVSQSAISKSVSRLEQDLGLTLFHRLRTGIEPTEIGREVIRKAGEILCVVQEIREMAGDFSALSNNRLSIGCVPMFSQMLSEAIDKILSRRSDVQINVSEKNSKETLQDVRNREVDIGILAVNDDLMKDPQLKCRVLLTTEMFVCVNKNSALAGQTSLSPERLKDQTIVSYKGSIIDRLERYFQNGTSLKYAVVTTNFETIKRSVTRGVAISILSGLTIRHQGFLLGGDIVAVPLVSEGQAVEMRIAWVTLRENSLPRMARNLLKILEDHVNSLKCD